MHAIEPGGLLNRDASESLRRDDAQIIVTLTGFDETLAWTKPSAIFLNPVIRLCSFQSLYDDRLPNFKNSILQR